MNGTIDLESDLIMVVWDLDEMVFQKKLVTVMEVLQQCHCFFEHAESDDFIQFQGTTAVDVPACFHNKCFRNSFAMLCICMDPFFETSGGTLSH